MELTFTSINKITPAGIEKACRAAGLELTMKTSQKTLPDNEHWHFKKGKLKGVLEITLLLNDNRLILSCKKNRGGEWVDNSILQLSETLKLVKV
jgi:hypothetical protein